LILTEVALILNTDKLMLLWKRKGRFYSWYT